jgi:acetyl/propionyl-CoA carboxylase alpha subunit
MIRALEDYVILGIQTTVGFLKDVVEHPEFARGEADTSFIERNIEGILGTGRGEDLETALAAAAVRTLKGKRARISGGERRAEVPDPWLLLGDFELGKT